MLDIVSTSLEGLWTKHTASHIGIVVGDLAVGLETYGRILEYDWIATHDASIPVRHETGQVLQVRVQTRWSTTGLPHVELIQGVPGTVWEPRDEAYLHHIGYWVDDLAVASARLTALGMPLQATLEDGSGIPTLFAYHRQPGGIRIELTDGTRVEKLQALLKARQDERVGNGRE